MKKYIVSFEIVTSVISLDEISSLLGVIRSSSSHELGTTRLLNKVWEQNIWKLDSLVAEEASLEEHLTSIFERLNLAKFNEKVSPHDRKLLLNVAVMFTEQMCSLTILPTHIQRIAKEGMILEITYYPCSN